MALKPEDVRVPVPMQLILNCYWLINVRWEGLTDWSIEEFFSTWKWKVYDRHPHEHVTLRQAMDEACGDITAEQCQAWIRHARRFSHGA